MGRPKKLRYPEDVPPPPCPRRSEEDVASPDALAGAISARAVNQRSATFRAEGALDFTVARFGWTSDQVYIVDIALAMLNRAEFAGPSVYLIRSHLIAWLGVSESTVKRRLKTLRDAGVLAVRSEATSKEMVTTEYELVSLKKRNSKGAYRPVAHATAPRSPSKASRRSTSVRDLG